MNEYSLRELLDAWRYLKLKVDQEKKEFEESQREDRLAILDLETMIRDDFKEKGIKSVKIDDEDAPDYLRGTCFLGKRFSSKLEDPEAFFNYVLETGRVELLFARASDTAVQEFIETEKQPPPGVTVNTTPKLNFRKAS